MERALELPHDVDALRALAHTHLALLDEHRQTIAQLRDANAQLEERNRVLAKWVFGRSSEQRVAAPADPSLQGHLFRNGRTSAPMMSRTAIGSVARASTYATSG